MGQQPSRPAPPPPTPAPPTPPPPPDPATLCRLRAVELNQMNNDAKAKQQQVDDCNPQEAQARRLKAIVEGNNTFITEQRKRLNEANTDIQHNIAINQNITAAVGPLAELEKETTKQKEELQESNRKLVQGQRQQRRNFLDSSPQSGVGGAPGVRTTDDKVMLAFWITFTVGLITAYIAVLQLFEVQMSTQQKIGTGVGGMAVAFGITYYCITMFG